MKVLNVQQLRVRYGAIQAVRGIDFHVNSGEIVSLIGANGAGKTTTLRAISGVVPYEGSVLVSDRELRSVASDEVVKLGVSHSPEGRGIFLGLTVRENMELGAYTRRDVDVVAQDQEHWLSVFPRLRERWNQVAGTLSGGEQQMLAMARALMSRPKILMLDEPSLGLAPLIVNQIFEVIVKLNTSEGMTVLLVEQNARMALKVSHRAYVLETGKVALEGKGSDLINNDQVRKSYLGG